MADRYDVVIIGAGPGGYVAGIRAGQLGLKTAVVEKANVGGVCLNWGCIPTKALLKNAEVVNLVRHNARDFGLEFEGLTARWEPAVKRSRRVVKRLTKGVEGLLRKYGAELINGEARLTSPNTVEVQPDGQVLEAEHIVIATGSRARMLPGMEADGRRVITSRHAVQLEEVPTRLLVMGAGAVGVEFAYIYNAYGSEVTIIEMLPRVLPLEDAESSAVLARAFAKQGIKIHTSTRVEKVQVTEDGVRITASSDDGDQVFEGDQVLVAIGRAPNTENLGLEEVGIETEKGFIKVNEQLQTNVPNVYAVGDVIGNPMLAHKAMHEGVAAVEHIAGMESHAVDASFIPNCVYCVPQVASIGMTEEAAREAGYDVQVSKFPFQAVGKALAVGEYEGHVKLVVDREYGEILGAHIVGPEATELIHEIVLARAAELTPDEIIAAVHAHPTLHEAIHEAALGVFGSPLHF